MNQMDESWGGSSKKEDAEASEVNTNRTQGTCLKLADRPTSTDTDSSATPKRKLSVFYRSFDVLAQIDQVKEKAAVEEIRRTCNNPSDRVDRTQTNETVSRNGEIGRQTCFHKKGFVNNCCSLIESGKFFGNSSQERLSNISCPNSAEITKATSTCTTTCKLPQLKEDAIGDNYASINDTSIGKHYTLNSNRNYEVKAVDGNVATDSRQNDSSCILTNTAESSGNEKIENAGTGRAANPTTDHRRGNSPHTRPICSRGFTRTDLVKIKDSEYPRSFVNTSSAGRRGKYTSVDAEMSSHEDSSIGSDSDDESIERSNVHAARRQRQELEKIDGSRSKSNSPSLSQPPSSFSACEPFGKPDANGARKVEKTEKIAELYGKREKRQAAFATRRSLSEGDCERYHRVKRRFRCTKEKETFNEQEHCPAFPSFNDTRLQIMGLSKAEDTDNLYRENMPETELERKYIAFSIGLCTDRITLHRRMALSLRQRDQTERNFRNEIRKMQEDIQDLCTLCTDQESIDKVTKVRDRLDMIERSVHSISCAAETLGAVYQEHRISRAIYIGDKYLQLLRAKCENLATEITETKQILWKNNIVIEETSGEIGDDLPKIRYRNGLPGNNRTMVARRRASIATISRPLNSQDMIKEAPRCCSQRNSVSGRVTLRRPSLCSEIQSSASSVVELRDIFEHTESRRNSVEENNNLLRIDETNSVNVTKSDVISNTESKERLFTKQNSLLESNVTKTVENQLKLCIRTAEPLGITRNIEAWQPILWYTLIFFIGFYVKQITSTSDTCNVPP